MTTIRDRIVEFRRVPASDLAPNPKNFRRHPKSQTDAMRVMLTEIGYAGALLARETPDGLLLLDGHLRRELTPDQLVPVLVLDVTEAEALVLLASYDPLSAMATVDAGALDALLREVSVSDDALRLMLADLAESVNLSDDGFGDAMGLLPSGEKAPFQQMTFTVSDAQAETVKAALAAAKGDTFVDTGNENSNGNALARICEAYRG